MYDISGAPFDSSFLRVESYVLDRDSFEIDRDIGDIAQAVRDLFFETLFQDIPGTGQQGPPLTHFCTSLMGVLSCFKASDSLFKKHSSGAKRLLSVCDKHSRPKCACTRQSCTKFSFNPLSELIAMCLKFLHVAAIAQRRHYANTIIFRAYEYARDL